MPLVRVDLPQSIGAEERASIGGIVSTLNIGRTVELKKQFYATLVDRLGTEAHVRPQDVLIVLTEVSKENWSFGSGEAQYA